VQRHPRNGAERAHNIDAVIRELAFAVPQAVRRAAAACCELAARSHSRFRVNARTAQLTQMRVCAAARRT
jgi:hypothetical protein